jgi:hypothetical protein
MDGCGGLVRGQPRMAVPSENRLPPATRRATPRVGGTGAALAAVADLFERLDLRDATNH